MVVPRRYVAIEELIVTESARRRGHTAALVEKVHTWARRRGIRDARRPLTCRLDAAWR